MNLFKDVMIMSSENHKEIKTGSLYHKRALETLLENQYTPNAIYVRGWELNTDEPVIMVAGARLCSSYGRYMARVLTQDLVNNGYAIATDMQLGVAGIAAKTALENGGKHFAFVPCGVDICYPPENQNVYSDSCKPGNGGIISMFDPGTSPSPARSVWNKCLMAALVPKLLVIEARKKSGIITLADYVLRCGGEVYAVPGRVTDRLSDGTNELIKKGAKMVTSIDDIV